MVLKNVVAVVIGATLLLCNGPSAADQYRADEFLNLDLSKAVLSPKPLGPASGFTPVSAETKTVPVNTEAQARLEPKAELKTVVRKARVAQVRTERTRRPVRTKLARRYTNPLDAQAFDTRIQVWPCRSGGICDWKRHRN